MPPSHPIPSRSSAAAQPCCSRAAACRQPPHTPHRKELVFPCLPCFPSFSLIARRYGSLPSEVEQATLARPRPGPPRRPALHPTLPADPAPPHGILCPALPILYVCPLPGRRSTVMHIRGREREGWQASAARWYLLGGCAVSGGGGCEQAQCHSPPSCVRQQLAYLTCRAERVFRPRGGGRATEASKGRGQASVDDRRRRDLPAAC